MSNDKPSDFTGFKMQFDTYPDGDIVQAMFVKTRADDYWSEISRQIIRTSDEGVRKCLIALGWTPPAEQAPDPEPIGLSYPVAYRLVSMDDGNGNSSPVLQGLHIVDGKRVWHTLLTQDWPYEKDSIPAFLPY